MKHITYILLLTGLIAAGTAKGGEIDLQITGIPSDGGMARIVVMQGAESYSGQRPVALTASVPIRNGQARWRADVPSGTYAIIAHHDRNGDDALNRPIFNLPLEPYGFSNGAWTSLGLPEFDDAAFEISDGISRQRIPLRMNAFVTLGQIGLTAIALFSTLLGALALHRRTHSNPTSKTGEYT